MHLIEKLPNGYQTVIGENGSTLSGGECQRLSIARALLKDAPVILLDEATASLDVDNETEIQKAISGLVKGKTDPLSLQHRMRTVEKVRRINKEYHHGNNHNEPKYIGVKGARVHNLKNVNVDVPLHQIVGVAGCVRFGQIFAGTWCFVCRGFQTISGVTFYLYKKAYDRSGESTGGARCYMSRQL
mgnify:CR=1 FL=1